MSRKRKAFTDISHLELKKHKFPEEFSFFDLFERLSIASDGNCLFRAIQYFLTGKESYHQRLRVEICNFMLKNYQEYEKLFEPQDDIETFAQYIEYKKKKTIWGDHIEIVAASKLKDFNFTVYESKSLTPKIVHINDPAFKMLFLEFFNGNHYNVLEPKTYSSLFHDKAPDSNFGSNHPVSETKMKIEMQKNSQEKIKINLKNESKQKSNELDDTSNQIRKELFQQPSKNKTHIIMNKATELYPKAKQNNNTYNEVYEYF